MAFAVHTRDFAERPGPALAAMRAAGPLVRVKVPLLGRLWVTTTHAATLEALKASDTLSVDGRAAGKSALPGLFRFAPQALKRMARNMLATDGTDHRRLRGAADDVFQRRLMQALRPAVAARAQALADGLTSGDDLVAAFARPLPLEVITELLGVPERRRAAFERFAASLSDTQTVWGGLKAVRSVLKLSPLLDEVVAELRAARRKDEDPRLIEAFARDESAAALSEDELVSMVFLLMVAGMETTTNLISGSVLALSRAPDQRAWLLEDADARGERAAEELLRFTSPVAGTKPRYAVRDTVVAGRRVARGEMVMALPVAANRDPAVFDDAESLRLDRFPNPHLSFGSGPHFCLGQQLARVELQEALKALYGRHPDLRPAASASASASAPPRYSARTGHRALEALPVEV